MDGPRKRALSPLAAGRWRPRSGDTPVVLVTGPRQCGKTTLVRDQVRRQAGIPHHGRRYRSGIGSQRSGRTGARPRQGYDRRGATRARSSPIDQKVCGCGSPRRPVSPYGIGQSSDRAAGLRESGRPHGDRQSAPAVAGRNSPPQAGVPQGGVQGKARQARAKP